MSFDIGSGLSSIANSAQSMVSGAKASFGQMGSLSSMGQQLSSALGNLANPSNLISKIRSINLPAGGNPIAKLVSSSAIFGGADANNDWRVRLSVPGGTIFDGSSVFSPLKEAGGLVFPYTPTINIGSSAKYDTVSTIHNNFPFMAYQNSAPDTITIQAPFFVEDSVQASYWLAAVHFLRSSTKMFTGDSSPAGNPPVILALNGYGDYVFKNVPVVVTNFSVSLDAGSDYIGTTPGQTGGLFGGGMSLAGVAGTAAGIAGMSGGIPGVQKLAGQVASVAGAAASVKNFLGSLGMGTVTGTTHVPTKSTISVTLQVAYSRESVRTFSLQKFVNGDFMTGSGAGYI